MEKENQRKETLVTDVGEFKKNVFCRAEKRNILGDCDRERKRQRTSDRI